VPPSTINEAVRTYIHELFLRLEIDINDPSDMARFRDNQKWMTRRRLQSERRTVAMNAFGWSALSALLGAIATTVSDWFLYMMGWHP
jgi:hypothetical protein